MTLADILNQMSILTDAGAWPFIRIGFISKENIDKLNINRNIFSIIAHFVIV